MNLHTKDYYKILELPPYATAGDIKQSYRRLAMIYHPDKNQDDPYAVVQFNEIKEAYETLTHPRKKEQWLQLRWYDKSMGKKRTAIAITPVNIFREMIELERYVSGLDVNRMDKQGLFEYLREILSNDTIAQLAPFDEAALKSEIVSKVLKIIKPLSSQNIADICDQLKKLTGDEKSLEAIERFKKSHRKNLFWEKTMVLWMILLTILLSILIFFLAR